MRQFQSILAWITVKRLQFSFDALPIPSNYGVKRNLQPRKKNYNHLAFHAQKENHTFDF